MAEQKTNAPKITYTKPADRGFPSVYSNNVAIGSTAFDVRIIFGEVLDTHGGELVIEQRVQVTMAWLEAKLLKDILTQRIDGYEKANGPIKLPGVSTEPNKTDPS
ncbi:MAG: DUF3467 domain-containing protein [Candidatus Korobacteraceae bacterium]|jgi:hypothetical protein